MIYLICLSDVWKYYYDSTTTAILRPPTEIYDSPIPPTNAHTKVADSCIPYILLRELLATAVLPSPSENRDVRCYEYA